MVSQYDSTANAEYPILLSEGTGAGSWAGTSKKTVQATVNPSTGIITAIGFNGNLTGDVTGDVTGDLTGNVTGDLTGNVTGNSDTATALAIDSATVTIKLTDGVQFINTTILTTTDDWFIETFTSGTNIYQRATSIADPSNVAVRTSPDSGTTWNGWTYPYAVWKA